MDTLINIPSDHTHTESELPYVRGVYSDFASLGGGSSQPRPSHHRPSIYMSRSADVFLRGLRRIGVVPNPRSFRVDLIQHRRG